MIDVWAAFVVAIIASAFFLAAWRSYNSLPRIPVLEQLALPDCMVVIPARNEEAAIARAVGTGRHDEPALC